MESSRTFITNAILLAALIVVALLLQNMKSAHEPTLVDTQIQPEKTAAPTSDNPTTQQQSGTLSPSTANVTPPPPPAPRPAIQFRGDDGGFDD